MNYPEKDIRKFLKESNYIEQEYSDEALEDAIEAWDYIFRDRKCITTKSILNVHAKLMRRLRPDIAGKIRTCAVYIGKEKKGFISVALLSEAVRGWIRICNIEKLKKATPRKREETVKGWHVLFEGIHPFEDGNGRVGRILYNYHRHRLGLPIHIIDENDRFEYYKWFLSSD